MRWRREQVNECEGVGVREDGAGQDGDDEVGAIEGLISQKRRLVPVKSTSEHLIGIMTYLRIIVQK